MVTEPGAGAAQAVLERRRHRAVGPQADDEGHRLAGGEAVHDEPDDPGRVEPVALLLRRVPPEREADAAPAPPDRQPRHVTRVTDLQPGRGGLGQHLPGSCGGPRGVGAHEVWQLVEPERGTQLEQGRGVERLEPQERREPAEGADVGPALGVVRHDLGLR